MNIAFDYDDTLYLAYDLFSVITNALIAAGHKIYIITHIEEQYRTYRENELKQHNIAYTELIISGNKLYECQKRGIEYIFDDCSDYFKDIVPIYLQAFNIPPIMKKTLKDGVEVEVSAFSRCTLSSGIRTGYSFRYKRKNRWSQWKDLIGSINDLRSQLGNFQDVNELKKLWHSGQIQ